MESILVTGGAGNIGSALVRVLAKRPNTEVVVADNLLTGSVEKIRDVPNVTFVKADCNDFDDIASLFYRFHFTHVFHFAAVVGVQRTLANPMLVLRDIAGIENVLRLPLVPLSPVHHEAVRDALRVAGCLQEQPA